MDRKKILLIEDDVTLSYNLKRFLEEENFQTFIAEDGNEGVAVAKELKPDLVICDLRIPSKDGYQVLGALATDNNTRLIPFIFLTANVENESVRKAMNLGADDYLFKPVDLDDLLNSIKARLMKSNYLIKNSANSTKLHSLEDRIMVNIGNKMNLLPLKDLKFLKAENPYVRLKFVNGKSALVRETLKEWSEKLPPKHFVRIHRNTIINLNYLSQLDKQGNSAFVIQLQEEVESFPISRRFSSKIKQQFSS